LSADSVDLAVFNASFHYSVDYEQTLCEVRRVLRSSGTFVVLDSPVYKLPEHGARMVEEKHATFLKRYGLRSDALPSVDFLDVPAIEKLRQSVGIHWQILKPWYGMQWHLRPLKAWLLKHRPPSRFWILSGRFQTQ
jgi:SAM-dependent methyltransferase